MGSVDTRPSDGNHPLWFNLSAFLRESWCAMCASVLEHHLDVGRMFCQKMAGNMFRVYIAWIFCTEMLE